MTRLFNAFYRQVLDMYPELFDEADQQEHLGICLCLMPILEPGLPDRIAREDLELPDGEHPLLGGTKGAQHRGILPTGQTWAYFCTGQDMLRRAGFIEAMPGYFSLDAALLALEQALPGEPLLSGKLVFSPYFRKKHHGHKLIVEQRLSDIRMGSYLKTALKLPDLVLTGEVLDAIREINHWQYFNEMLREKPLFTKRIKPGLKVLFHGKPGTGKTQVAAILGNDLERSVYRVDLSQVVSKYIGETEKNLGKVFDLAGYRNWILFFDEGDALFGKRTSVNSSHDRYANQEVAYLLQRIEDYPGIVIISTNLKDNIDPAFLRRFQIVAEFSIPDRPQRKAIWQKLLSEMNGLELDIKEDDFEELSQTELSGGSITNAVSYAMQKAIFEKEPISVPLLKTGIIRELRKENRLMSL